MLCNSCQCLDLDQICGLTPGEGLGGSNGYTLSSKAERTNLYHEGHEEIKLWCDLCQVVFRNESGLTAMYPHALLASAEPGVLPVSSVKDVADGRYYGDEKMFDVFCSQDDPNTTLVKGSTLGRPLQSDECIAIASRWLEECITQSSYAHKYCPKMEQNNYRMPSRAINVGPADGSQDPYLQPMPAGAMGQWVALSHCWGSAVTLNTTKDTLKSREQKIPFEELPLSFQDAVTITRKLGYRYLWIDSLCIIQDSVEDWNVESGSMGHIYSNAVVCIAAEAAADSNLGIFESSKTERFSGLAEGRYVRPSDGTAGSLWFRESKAESSLIPNYLPEPLISMEGPLSRRAWALQENFLAPRTIRYGQKELKWSCRSFKCVEEEPHRRVPCDDSKHIFRALEPVVVPTVPILSKKEILDCWYKMVNEFAVRKLTYEVDRLPAISGIAKEIRSRVGEAYTYRAGLWQQDIHRGLLWSTNGQALVGTQYTGPSWSWASITWSAFTPSPIYNMEEFPPDSFWIANLSPFYSSSDTSIVSVKVESSSIDPYLKVRSAALTLCGLAYSFDSLLEASRPAFHQPFFSRSSKLTGSVTYCELDLYKPGLWTASDLENRGIIYLQIAKTQRNSWETGILWALILEPTYETANQYKRIGIAEVCSGDSMFKGWTKREIQIV